MGRLRTLLMVAGALALAAAGAVALFNGGVAYKLPPAAGAQR